MFLTRRIYLLTIRTIRNGSSEAESLAGSDYFKKLVSQSNENSKSENNEIIKKSQSFAKKFLSQQKRPNKYSKAQNLNQKPLKIKQDSNDRANKQLKQEIFHKTDKINQELIEISEANKIRKIEPKELSQIDDEDENLTEDQLLEKEIKKLEPSIRPVVYNLAYFANKNPVVRTLVEMGVFIRKWDADPSIAKFVLSLDLDKDLKPHLIFLHDIGIPAESHAFILTKNPLFLKESIQNLTLRIDYLKSKKFTDDMIKKILTQTPKWLSLNVQEVDSRLGWLQKQFNLSGAELRQIVTERPKLVTLPLNVVHKVKFAMTDFLSYSGDSLKNLILNYPKLFTKDFEKIESNFIFLTQVMKLTHQDIEQYPAVLVCPLQTLKIRYTFLKSLDRLQFDPTKPNFISLKAFCEPDEKIFCSRTAKTSLDEFKKFLKTL